MGDLCIVQDFCIFCVFGYSRIEIDVRVGWAVLLFSGMALRRESLLHRYL